jgi:hypothetical protein
MSTMSSSQSFIQIVDGKIVHSGGVDSSGSWYSNGHLFELSYHNGPGLWMKFTAVSPDRMTLVDVKGETIHLVKNTLIKPLTQADLIGTWNFASFSPSSNIGFTGKITFGPGSNTNANFTETLDHSTLNGVTHALVWNDVKQGSWFSNGYTITQIFRQSKYQLRRNDIEINEF